MPIRYALIIAVLLTCAQSATAQSAPDAEAPVSGEVVRHKPRSGMPFPRSNSSDKFLDTGMIYRLPKPSRNEKLKDVPRKGNYLMKLPKCAESKTRRTEIFHYTMQTANYDITFYDPNDRNQVRGAQAAKSKTVPYRGGRLLDLKKNPDEAFQLLAMPLNVECLPTRFTVVLENNRRFIEHREGTHAWKSASSVK